MPFIHVVGHQVVVAKLPEHGNPAKPEDCLLTKAVVLVTAIEFAGQGLDEGRVFQKGRIQQINRNLVPFTSVDCVLPCPD